VNESDPGLGHVRYEAVGEVGKLCFRFSDLDKLLKEIKACPEVEGVNLPRLPPKCPVMYILGGKFGKRFNDERKRQLQQFLDQLLATPKVLHLPPFKAFVKARRKVSFAARECTSAAREWLLKRNLRGGMQVTVRASDLEKELCEASAFAALKAAREQGAGTHPLPTTLYKKQYCVSGRWQSAWYMSFEDEEATQRQVEAARQRAAKEEAARQRRAAAREAEELKAGNQVVVVDWWRWSKEPVVLPIGALGRVVLIDDDCV
jgi:hypothetical protein